MIGQTLAHYEILEKIGSGGMGDVYLAEDTKLDRKVALKVLPPDLAENEQRRARFQREARAIAALDHPNIVQVFSVEEAEGLHFITMQLVHGKTLTELLPNNGFPLNKFFDIAIPLADAVAAAHQEGITHRDLKPDNVMVGEDGRVKVLDFGLAKPTAGLVSTGGESNLPTQAKTAEGVIVGTLNYMSPEQAQGKAVDPRSDIFSLGVVLYEMLTGRRPFAGETPADVLSNIIKDTPASLSEVNPLVPRDVARLVKRCLAKDPIRRYQSAIDLRNDLEETKQDVDSGEAVVGTLPNQAKPAGLGRFWLVGAATALSLAAWLMWPRGESSRDAVPRLANPVQLTSGVGVEDFPTWSHDGRTLAFESAGDIWVTPVDQAQPVNRTPDHGGIDAVPSWSPDGSQIAFWSDRDGGGYFVMSALGGPARKVISASFMRAWPPQWSSDGDEVAVFDPDEVSVQVVTLATRESRWLTLPGETLGRYDVRWSRDGSLAAYIDATARGIDLTRLLVFRVADEQSFAVTNGLTRVWSPTWSADGRKLFFLSNRGGSMDLWQQALSPDGTPVGEAQAVTAGIGMRRAVFSPDGTKLAYSQGRRVSNLWRAPIREDRPATWADVQQMTFDQAYIEAADVSPDAQRLVFSSDRGGKLDLWSFPSAGGDMMEVTDDPAPDWFPRWSPDGTKIAFHSYRSGRREIWVTPVGGGPARQLTDGEADGAESWQPTWSPDGREIAFVSTDGGDVDAYIIPSAGGPARPLMRGREETWQPDWSPDGEWLVTQRGELLPAAGGEAVSLTDADNARWSRDGKWVFVAGRGERAGNLWAVTVQDGSERQMTDLAGKRGTLIGSCLATDGQYIYFCWGEDLGDIWVMDVVTDETE